MCRTTATKSWIAPFVVPLLFCGCGESVPFGQVDGTVRADGQPMEQVMVVFIPEDPHQPQSIGVTDAEGKFQLRCNNARLGAVVGEHRVTLVDAAVAPAGHSKYDDELPEGDAAPVSRIPPIYGRPDRTPLRQSIEPGDQNVTIDIPAVKKPG